MPLIWLHVEEMNEFSSLWDLRWKWRTDVSNIRIFSNSNSLTFPLFCLIFQFPFSICFSAVICFPFETDVLKVNKWWNVRVWGSHNQCQLQQSVFESDKQQLKNNSGEAVPCWPPPSHPSNTPSPASFITLEGCKCLQWWWRRQGLSESTGCFTAGPSQRSLLRPGSIQVHPVTEMLP